MVRSGAFCKLLGFLGCLLLVPGIRAAGQAPSQTVESALARALEAERRGDVGGTRRAYETAVRAFPESAAIWAEYGGWLLARGERKRARRALEESSQLGSPRPSVQRKLMLLYLDEKRPRPAITAYRRAVALEGGWGLRTWVVFGLVGCGGLVLPLFLLLLAHLGQRRAPLTTVYLRSGAVLVTAAYAQLVGLIGLGVLLAGDPLLGLLGAGTREGAACTLGGVLCGALVVAGGALLWTRGEAAEPGVRPGPSTLPAALALGLGIHALNLALLSLLIRVPLLGSLLVPSSGNVQSGLLELLSGPGGFLWVLLVAVLAGPLAEELFFRGALQPALAERVGERRAVVLGALAFALSHPGVVVPSFVAGLVLGETRRRTGGVALGLLAHMVMNGAALVAHLLR